MNIQEAVNELDRALIAAFGTDLHLELKATTVLVRDVDSVVFGWSHEATIALATLARHSTADAITVLEGVREVASRHWADGHRIGETAGRREMVNVVHDLLGIDRIVLAIERIGEGR
jgi:hypothetical protein